MCGDGGNDVGALKQAFSRQEFGLFLFNAFAASGRCGFSIAGGLWECLELGQFLQIGAVIQVLLVEHGS